MVNADKIARRIRSLAEELAAQMTTDRMTAECHDWMGVAFERLIQADKAVRHAIKAAELTPNADASPDQPEGVSVSRGVDETGYTTMAK